MSVTHVPLRLRRLVRRRALEVCEYCRLPECAAFAAHEIDHVIAESHRGRTTLENLALACPECNRLKGTNLATTDPMSGKIVQLFNPRRDAWLEHFKFVKGAITPLTAIGRATAQLLDFNLPARVQVRARLARSGHLRLPIKRGSA